MLDGQAWRRFLPDMPVPDFCDPGVIVRDALHALDRGRRLTVPEWAEQGRILDTNRSSGFWKNSFAPYMTEPASMVTSRKYAAGVFVGPARTTKTESLIQNAIGHRIDCRPSDVLVVCQTQNSAKDFSEKKLGPMLRANRSLAVKQLTGRGADNIHSKKFKGNMHLAIGWPVIGYFSQNEWVLVLITDRDRMTDDVDGEGSPFVLALKRVTHAGSLGFVVSESSPGRIVEKDDWKASTPHEAPPCSGIMSEYNQGTRGAFYWFCPHCNEPFRPEFSALRWEDKATPGESARTVEMICPHGCCIEPSHKFACNAAGIWLHESNSGNGVVEIDDPDIRDTDIVSWRCEGPIAAMQNWEQLVLRYLQARDVFNLTGDDTQLKATINLDQGRAYAPAVREIGESLSEETLKGFAEDYPMKVAPALTRFITWQFDIQGNRFVGQADAWGPGLERWLIDRVEISIPPESAPGGERDVDGHASRSIDPARYVEDWDVLTPFLSKVYPVAGSAYGMMPIAMIVDSAGKKGVTPNAYAFLRKMKKAGYRKRFFLVKGSPKIEDRAAYREPEKVLQKRGHSTSDIRLIFAGTNKLKDEIVLSLTRKAHGPGKYHLPKDAPPAVFVEMTAETLTDKGWEKKKQGLANEALDLAVYGKALAIILKAETINWDRPPEWALPVANNNFAVRLTEAEAPITVPGTPAQPAAVAKRRRVRSSAL